MSASQFFTILHARWKLVALIFLAIVGTVVGVSLLLPKQYSANASVMIDVKSPDPIAGIIVPGMMSPTYMATQVDIIASDRVAQGVVRALKLQDNTAMRAQWQEATGGAGSYQAWLGELLQKNLSVKPARESNVINVSFSAVEPKFAAALANAFVQSYIDTTVELRVAPARQYAGFFDERASALRAELDEAQGRLSAYQKANGVTAADERLDIETARLNELSSQLVALQAVSAESTSRKNQAVESAETLQDVINNPVVAGLKSDLLRQQARLEEIGARLGSAHPQVRELTANIAELQSKLDQEMRRVGRSVGVTNTINRSREAQVRGALEAQRARVLRLKEVRDGMNVLVRDVENAQRAYDTVRSRAAQSTLESQSTQTNVFMLSPAVEPTTPSSPRLLLNTVLGAAVALLLAAAAALLLEMADARVRSAQDLEASVSVPLLGVLDAPHATGVFARRRHSQIRKRVLGGLRPLPRLT
jgi:chain length determinant protein EpsF